MWVGLYADLIARHGAPGTRLLDLGCGTGKSALGLSRRGFGVTGVDLSPEMLAAARAKEGAGEVRFVRGDVRALPDLGPFDVVTTMGEPFTHLAGEEELAAAFRGAARALVPGGLFVFDLPTAGFNDRLATWSVIDEAEDAVILWRGAPAGTGPHTTDLTIDTFLAEADGRWRRQQETVTHHHVGPGRVEALLSAAGFALDAAYGLYKGELLPEADQELHRKSIVVAHKTAPEAG
ncbi:class I SAM-dependent methyltransferase [Streptomyces hoynatensis]|uniref:class I SAM-dependent methyltransferase n=1 Tax=Streptomyces hoynatensis TaxID=1141874 RepID=UPI001F4E8D45|nr:class I SAM-dependent methyltransferase [Streptomyces hoynatensis]